MRMHAPISVTGRMIFNLLPLLEEAATAVSEAIGVMLGLALVAGAEKTLEIRRQLGQSRFLEVPAALT